MSKHSKHAKISRLGEPNFGSRTDIGRVREHNEDSLVAKNPLYAVFDGMGGHAAGEVASEIASKVVAAHAPEELDAEALGQAVL
ncbi:MAG: protein phosphatase, partial [Phoenicibacter congonensis]|nr:protein phosphatase [Phoenicibacter congonensis]